MIVGILLKNLGAIKDSKFQKKMPATFSLLFQLVSEKND